MENKIKWNPLTDLGVFDGAIKHKGEENRGFDMFEFDMPVDDYIKVQENTKEIKSRKDYFEKTNTKEDISGFDKPDKFNTEGIPTPVLEFDVFGNKTGWQEGYRRGLYAKSKGQDTIRTWMAYENRPGLNSKIAKKEYDAFSDYE